MDWCDERYVRLYTRDTVDWQMWPWEARCVLPLLLRKVNRAGVLDLGRYGTKGLAVALLLPAEVVEVGLAALLDDGCVVLTGSTLVIRNYLEAQEATQSDRARKREQRERARASALQTGQAVTIRDSESQDVTESHAESQAVTSGHAESRAVTPCLAMPSHAVPLLVASEDAPPAKRERGRRSACPASDSDEHEVESWVLRWRIDRGHPEFAGFLDHHRAKRSLFADWSAAWRTWQRNATRFAARGTGARAVQPAESDAPWLKALGGDGWTT